MTPQASARRSLCGAALLDLAISPLFAWNVLVDPLRAEFGWSDVRLSGIFSFALLSYTVGVLVGGRLAAVRRPPRLALLTAAGSGGGLAVGALVPSYVGLLVGYGLLFGAATGVGYVTAVSIAGTLQGVRRGSALTFVVSAYAAGTIVVAPPLDALIHGVGWRLALLAVAAVVVLATLAAAVLLRDTQPPAALRQARRAPRISRGVLALGALKGLGSAPALAAFAHAAAVSMGAAAVAVPVLSAGNLLGRMVAGPLTDRVGLTAALYANVTALAGACTVLGWPLGSKITFAALLVLGAQYGALSVLVPMATAATVPRESFGPSYGSSSAAGVSRGCWHPPLWRGWPVPTASGRPSGPASS
ncbi:MAG: MFS transporter [Carbonactinosporaceae bacterium]